MQHCNRKLYPDTKFGYPTSNSMGDSYALFVCLVALRPKSTAMVMVGLSVHLTTIFPGQA